MKKKIASLPDKPGVYLFKNKKGAVIYIGKARCLKDRIKSYFQEITLDSKTSYLLSEINDFEIVITDSEKEAFLLENNLVRKYQPKYNIRLKDDKSYPYVKITIQENFPRILLTRQVEKDGSKYFGPFAPAFQAKNTIHLMGKYFHIRKCNEPIPGKRKRPCLDYDMGLCSAPCVNLISESEYRESVNNTILFLGGKTDQLTNALTKKMFDLVSKEKFEQAAFYRDLIRTIKEVKEKPQMISVEPEDLDIFGFYRRENQVGVQVFIMRKGKVIDKNEFYWSKIMDNSDQELLSSFLAQFYDYRPDIPSKIILPFQPKNKEFLASSLIEKTQRKPEIIVPSSGKYKRLVDLANKNAKLFLEIKTKEIPALTELKQILNLLKIPRWIEAFDISNIMGQESVGSLIVFQNGQPFKKEYRKFKIKTVTGIDDVASIFEIVKRRYQRLLKEKKDLPDLILIDGGKGQLNAAIRALNEVKLNHLPVISIAKQEELIFTPQRKEAIILDKNSPALKLIQHIRDEAHRFAISFHRQLRKKKSFKSILDEIPGIGPERKKALLTKYKNLVQIKKAPPEELNKIIGSKATQELLKRIKE
ncbi:MAG: excinuclease ABC subunit UvrC [Candidatus Aminicenantia bacterium]